MGYGHFGVFAALAAVGAGLRITVEQTGRHVAASPMRSATAVAIPVAVFLALVWALQVPIVSRPAVRPAPILGGGAVVLLVPLATPTVSLAVVVAAMAVVCAAVVAVSTASPSSHAR